MPHLEVDCKGLCLERLAQTLDLQSPAADVPHESLHFVDESSEALYALTARVTPAVITACQCRHDLVHEVTIIWVGKRLKMRRWDFEKTNCQCTLFLFGWEPAVSRCIWNGYLLWWDLLEEHEEDMDEQEEAMLEGEEAIAYHEAKWRLCEGERGSEILEDGEESVDSV
ncbi:hypothetical protein AAF712_005096 [Marasmius tenuissimus]|uniref:Uncharacterized protein n=1 Tax=Marasmius tenuissimus TaxID=585030 RepID=A0ABR3A3I2_9AGAR